jgi:hypothetical protein
MEVRTITEVLDHITEKPLQNHVEIGKRNYYIDFEGNICTRGTRETDEGIEYIFLNISSDILFSEIMKADVVDFNEEASDEV